MIDDPNEARATDEPNDARATDEANGTRATDEANGTRATDEANGTRPTDDQNARWQAPEGGEPLTEDHVRDALRVVIDPELGISVVDLGLVYDINVDDEVVKVTYTLTSMGCPVGPLIEQQMQTILTQIPGVRYVESALTFDPPWSPEKMSEDAKIAMGMF